MTIEHLCSRFKVTKGSFYHHFSGMPDFEKQLIQYWEADTIGKITHIIETVDTPKEQLQLFTRLVFTVPDKTEVSLRAWALHNRLVKLMLEKIDEKKVQVIRDLYQQIGVSKQHAAELALVAHLCWLGIQSYHAIVPEGKQKTVALINTFMKNQVKDALEGKKQHNQ
jgi:AcrR family transcriptional regulator